MLPRTGVLRIGALGWTTDERQADALRLPWRRRRTARPPVPPRPGGLPRRGDRLREGDRRARQPDPVPAQGLARRAGGEDRDEEAPDPGAPRRDGDQPLEGDPGLGGAAEGRRLARTSV